jgi:carbamoyl-phosphate synthase large subunit
MKYINALVTGIGGPTAQGILKGLHKMNNIRIIGVDRREVTSGNQFCDQVYQIPRYTETELYKSTILRIVHEENIDVIFPSLHEEIEIYHQARDLWNAEIALPTSENFDILLNKESIYEYLSETLGDKYIPKYCGFNSEADLREIKDLYFPNDSHVVAKLVSGHGSLGLAVLTDNENYLQALKNGSKKVIRFEDYGKITRPEDRKILMEHLNGSEYSVDVFIHEGKVVVAVPRERAGVSNGIVLDGTVIKDDELIQISSEITEKIAISGFLNLQFYRTEDGYKLTDINPRFCGSQIMSLGANVNFPALFIQYNVLGNPHPVEPKWNTRMLRYRDEIFVHDE